jgi:hypothetical protein
MLDWPLTHQIVVLFLLALPIASLAWTFTHEEIFRESQEYCRERAQNARSLWVRKFFYPWQCEYCFSHYVTILVLFVTRYKLLYGDWRGYVLAGFALIWIANQYMSIYARLRLDIKRERVEIKGVEAEVNEKVDEIRNGSSRRAA